MTTTIEELKPMFLRLKLAAMYEHAQEMLDDVETSSMSHMDLLKHLFEAEIVRRDESALNRRIKQANCRYRDACMSGIDYSIDRGLNKAKLSQLGSCDWIRKHQNCIITGKTGCGKTWIAGALTNAACRAGLTARFYRLPLLLKELSKNRDLESETRRKMRELGRIDLLVLDDRGIGQLDAINRSDLLEIIESRCGNGSTMITSVMPVKAWAEYIQDPTYSDSILDRLVRNAHRIEMTGISMRSLEKYGAIDKNK